MDSKADKLWKKTERDRQKRLRPGECLKYIRLVLDSHILSSYYGKEFLAELKNAKREIKYDIKTLPISGCISWERNICQLSLEPEKTNGLTDVWQKENHVVRILTYMELNQIIKMKALPTIFDHFHKHYANMQHIVLFLHTNEALSAEMSSALLELQIIHQLKVLQVRPPIKNLATQVVHLTKAVAEIPFKKQKSEVLDTFKKFLVNDNKQCVRVVGTNGLGRLWQQHLNRLPLVTLEVADTIIDKYSCPKKMLDDFENNPNAVKELADLRIKRSGPVALQSDRRIGEVLANKLFMLYNSKEPTQFI